MKKIISYIKQFIQEELSWKYLLVLSGFLAICIGYNYFSGPVDWWDRLHQKYAGTPWLIPMFTFFYFIGFAGAFGLYSLFNKHNNFYLKPSFWGLIIFACLLFAVRTAAYDFTSFFKQWYTGVDAYFNTIVTRSYFRMGLLILPVIIWWWIFDRKQLTLYGCSLKDYDTRPYLVMLLLMVPLIFWASFQTDFLGTYPKAKLLRNYDLFNPDHIRYFIIYELAYGLDFISIEFFFRGFLVLAMLRFVGPGAILPMASFYVFIHFGKPMGETISSFFGGTLLGIISYYGRSIFGGIIVHMGIAWMMEVGAILSTLWMGKH